MYKKSIYKSKLKKEAGKYSVFMEVSTVKIGEHKFNFGCAEIECSNPATFTFHNSYFKETPNYNKSNSKGDFLYDFNDPDIIEDLYDSNYVRYVDKEEY